MLASRPINRGCVDVKFNNKNNNNNNNNNLISTSNAPSPKMPSVYVPAPVHSLPKHNVHRMNRLIFMPTGFVAMGKK